MILPFSTQIDKKPTYFIEKIWNGLLQEKFNLIAYHKFRDDAALVGVIDQWDIPESKAVKITTIREDTNKRWKQGVLIDFFINSRTKKMFRFAPAIPVVSTQKIFMTYYHSDIIQISVDGRELFGYERLQLALNDGFDTWNDFFEYFYPIIQNHPDKLFKGKIIHWTNLKY
ncbi:hypothetical protein N4T20_02610 [Flavobacterium sp. TR2]|uniref:hypothetical protein n=1 Tax=Flavobacterium sp. TR2 TaxID=2977321 RepID=UPI0021B14A64|nr:hypothetical protein [Flavobacterium sp. TR2]UWY28823.1 hypothetical protein N4T20_02610 [Flavobacterium sp. TR2]